MTTIVVDRKERLMVSDRMMVCGGNHKTRIKKIRRLGEDDDEVLVGTCGDIEAGEAFVLWFRDQIRYEKGMRLQQPGGKDDYYPHVDTFHALVLDESGSLSWYAKAGYPVEITDRYFGIGSGSDFALGAIMAGASLQKAVRIASLFDVNTGFGIQVESLGE